MLPYDSLLSRHNINIRTIWEQLIYKEKEKKQRAKPDSKVFSSFWQEREATGKGDEAPQQGSRRRAIKTLGLRSSVLD